MGFLNILVLLNYINEVIFPSCIVDPYGEVCLAQQEREMIKMGHSIEIIAGMSKRDRKFYLALLRSVCKRTQQVKERLQTSLSNDDNQKFLSDIEHFESETQKILKTFE